VLTVERYPVQLVCEVLDCSRSSYYYQGCLAAALPLQEGVAAVAAEWPTYGYRRVTAELHRRGWVVNHKRVRQLMEEMGLTVQVRRKRRRTTDSRHSFPRYPNLVLGLMALYPEHIWVADITYVRLGQGFVYLAVIMDVFTRAIRGWCLSRSLDERLALTALQQALGRHGAPRIHHSDQGVQYASSGYTEMLQRQGVQISMAEVGEPTQNGFAERLMRTIKEEQVDLSEYQDYADACHQLGRFLDDVYMHKRVHSSLGYLTPAEFEAAWARTRGCVEPA